MTLRWSLILSAGILAAALCAACRPNETLEAQSSDARIKAAVKAKLASKVDAATLTSVEVNVTDGVVTLAGPVHSAAEGQRIAQVAGTVKGVVNVRNELQVLGQQSVRPAASPPPAGKAS